MASQAMPQLALSESATVIDFKTRQRVAPDDNLIQTRAYLERAKRDKSPLALKIAICYLLKAIHQHG